MAEPVNVTHLPTAQPPIMANTSDVFSTPALFEHSQRVAKVFAASELVPAHLRKNGVTDVLLAYAIAKRMGEDPVIVMQNIYFVSGRAGWKSEYMIARANKSGVFKGRINWRTTGQGDTMAVTAFAKLAETGDEVTATASMGMAKAEGWTRNSKYQTMPEHMLRWRSATMLIRLFAPEVMLGIAAVEELQDIQTLHPGADGAYSVATPQAIDAALEAAEESGRVQAPEPVNAPTEPTVSAPQGEREGTDSAATKLDVKATAKMIATLSSEQLAEWKAANTQRLYALKPIERAPILAAIQVKEQEIAANG